MKAPARVWAAALAYDEEEALPGVLEGLEAALGALGRPARVLVVDDGSSDATPAIASSRRGAVPVELARHSRNLGVARAFDTAIRRFCAAAGPDDSLILLEGDGSCDLAAIPRLVAALDAGADLVCATRLRPGGGYAGTPWTRRLLSRAANLGCALLFRAPGVTDYTIFYRGYRARPLRRALAAFGERFIESRGLAANAEILRKLQRAGPLACAEVPAIHRFAAKGGPRPGWTMRGTADYLGLFAREASAAFPAARTGLPR